MLKKTLGFIGLGARGFGLIRTLTLLLEDKWEIVALCDKYQDRIDRAAKYLTEHDRPMPFCTTDDEQFFARDMDAVLVASSWDAHIEHAIMSMKRGIPVGMEVGGAYTVDDCFRLVHTQEETRVPFMFMENCCYDKKELAVLKMVRENLFGDICYCTGGYMHDLRDEIGCGEENRHYRLVNYINRNCENYPTHELGPIANIMHINRGNRMVKLVSVASKAIGMHDYMVRNKPEKSDIVFNQGDIINTIITCNDGSVIRLTLDTTLPRAYSRDFSVRGTKGAFFEANNSIFLEGIHDYSEWDTRPKSPEFKEYKSDNFDEYYEKYEDILWKKYNPTAGHGGMDWIIYKAFLDGVRENKPLPINVYDAASWMVITPLSEQSILTGQTVAIPDFTSGRWMKPQKEYEWEFNPFSR